MVYAADEMVLIISGVGKLAMAGAVGYGLGLFPNHRRWPLLINLGIAGHRDYPLGALCLAHKITDSESGRCFFPQLPFATSCPTLPLTTHARPRVDYADDCLYDMEAAGFYEMAVKFSSSELIHVVKVVSDNAENAIANINEALVESWMGERLAAIEQLLIELNRLRQMMPVVEDSPLYRQIAGQFHFSVTSDLRLKALLQRWELVRGGEALAWRDGNPRNAKQLLVWMENQLESVKFSL